MNILPTRMTIWDRLDPPISPERLAKSDHAAAIIKKKVLPESARNRGLADPPQQERVTKPSHAATRVKKKTDN
ncbi:hypothetical protein HDU86_007650 [Geranomyces michiganensis]|nr:hypothetical protein HDU86_007650 [Geranomyces michiganensis]